MLLGWRPGEFWDSTPAELASALRLNGMFNGPDGETIDALMKRFPDNEKE